MDRFSSPGPHDASAGRRLAIGAFVLDLARGELFTAAGERATLRPKVLELLCVLGARAGEVVSKDELIDLLWPDVVVTEDSLTQAVAEARRFVGDKLHQWVRTMPRRGYLLAKHTLADAAPVPRRLPSCDAPLLGRADDLVNLEALLQPGALVTLVGAGGIGKTRLALELACRVVNGAAGTAWWVDLAPATDAAQVLPMVAAALGVSTSGPGAQEQIAAALAAHRGLLVLDNCEHRADAVAELVLALRSVAPGLAWLATSQAPLQLQAEQVYRLGTLEVPAADAGLDDARRCGALSLLEQRARARDHRFALDESTLPLAIEICRRLDGVALALEMAAARLSALGVGGVHAMLAERLDSLGHDRRDVPARQRSLLATLEWSWSLLTGAQQHALQALATFVGHFDTAMACAVMGTGDAPELLCALVDKSLVSVESAGEPRRYRLLDSMRLFALERMQLSAQASTAFARHRLAMAMVAGHFDRDRSPGRGDAFFRRYLPRLSDLSNAFDNACQAEDAEAAAALLDILRKLDVMRDALPAMEGRLRAVLPLLPAASPFARARICLVVASCGWIKLPGLPAVEAAAHAVQALRGHATAGWRLQGALLLLAVEQARLGHTSQAATALDEALALESDGDLLERRAVSQASASHVAMFAGDSACALARMEKACTLAQRAGASSTLDYVMSHLSALALDNGDIEAARRHAANAVQRARERHTHILLAEGLVWAMQAELAAGDVGSARRMVGEALQYTFGSRVLRYPTDVFATLALRIGEVETGCRLLGWAQAQTPAEPNAAGRAREQQRSALKRQAASSLGEAAVNDLLTQGAGMSQTEMAALAATLEGPTVPPVPRALPGPSVQGS